MLYLDEGEDAVQLNSIREEHNIPEDIPDVEVEDYAMRQVQEALILKRLDQIKAVSGKSSRKCDKSAY